MRPWAGAHPPARTSCPTASAALPGSVPFGWEIGSTRDEAHMKHHRWLTVAVAFVLILIAAGAYVVLAPSGPSSVSSGPSLVPGGYLATPPSQLIFLRWTTTGNQITGSAQVVTTTGKAPAEKTTVQTETLSGHISGAQVSLRLLGYTDSGTLTSNGLRLSAPGKTGDLVALTFRPANPFAYDQALARFKKAVRQDDFMARTREDTDRKVAQIKSDMAALPGDEATLAADVGSINMALGTVTTALGTVTAAAQNPTGCYLTDDDAEAVSRAVDAVGREVVVVSTAVKSLRQIVSQLQNTHSQVTVPAQTITTANAAISTTIATTNRYIGQANAALASAYQTAAQTTAAQCPYGTPLPQPAPLGTIT